MQRRLIGKYIAAKETQANMNPNTEIVTGNE
jgi:hypothetical protein